MNTLRVCLPVLRVVHSSLFFWLVLIMNLPHLCKRKSRVSRHLWDLLFKLVLQLVSFGISVMAHFCGYFRFGDSLKGRQVMGAYERFLKGRSISIEVWKGVKDHIIIPSLSYATETWIWNIIQQSWTLTVEMSYWKCMKCVKMQKVMNVYKSFSMGEAGKGMECGVVGWVKCSALRWFGHVTRMNENEFVKRVSPNS